MIGTSTFGMTSLTWLFGTSEITDGPDSARSPAGFDFSTTGGTKRASCSGAVILSAGSTTSVSSAQVSSTVSGTIELKISSLVTACPSMVACGTALPVLSDRRTTTVFDVG